MTIEHSRNFLLKIGQADSPETFVSLGAQANGSLSLSATRIDTTNKTTQNWRTSLGGLREFVANGDGYADWPDTTGLDLLLTQALAGNDFSGQVQYNSTPETFTGTVQATNMQITGQNESATGWSTTWELSQGAPVKA